MKFLYPVLTLLILPLVGIAWLVKKVVVPFKKSSQNGMFRLKKEGKWILFSPYFEFETYLKETKLLIKVVVQLGNDGIKKDLIVPAAAGVEGINPKSLLYREVTLFLINQGETPVEVTPKYLEIKGDTISKLVDVPQLIAAGHYYECEPSLAKDRRDAMAYELNVVLEHDGIMHEIRGTALRLSIEALDEKYHKADHA